MQIHGQKTLLCQRVQQIRQFLPTVCATIQHIPCCKIYTHVQKQSDKIKMKIEIKNQNQTWKMKMKHEINKDAAAAAAGAAASPAAHA